MRDEWRNSRIRNYLDLASGKTKPNDTVIDLSEQCSIPVYGGNGILGYSSQVLINHETLVIGRVGEYCGTVRYVNTPCWVTDNAIYAKSIDEDYIYPKFIAYLLSFQKLGRFRKRGGQPLISQKNIYTLRIALPPLPEQRRIAEILSTWDAAIGLVEQRIAAAEQHKKGLMQRLLTGRARFPEFVQSKDYRLTRFGPIPADWKLVPIRSVATVNKESLGSNSDPEHKYLYLEISMVDKGKITMPTERHKFADLPSRARRVLHRGDVIMSTVRPNLLGFALCDFEPQAMLCSTGFALLSPEDLPDSQFIYQNLYSDVITRQVHGLVTGSNYPAVNISEVKRLELFWPSKAERVKIAAVLQTCDREIELLTRKRDALQRQQKGLMQRLLTGRVRV